METIRIHPVPKTSFNKDRPVSDLLLAQLEHFQHVVQKQGIVVDPALPGEIHTEAGAARYITAVTREIRMRALAMQKGTVASGPQLIKKSLRSVAPGDNIAGLAIAASEETKPKQKTAAKAKNSAKKARKK